MNINEHLKNTKEYLIILRTLKQYYRTSSKVTKKYIELLYDLETKKTTNN